MNIDQNKVNDKCTKSYRADVRTLFSDDEINILQLVGEGYNNDKISKTLFISTHTVKAHLRTIFRKLDVTSRTRAVYVALKLGLID